MFKSDFELPQNGRVVLHLTNNKVTKVELLKGDEFIMSVESFIELYERAGFIYLHQDDLPSICRDCEHQVFEPE